MGAGVLCADAGAGVAGPQLRQPSDGCAGQDLLTKRLSIVHQNKYHSKNDIMHNQLWKDWGCGGISIGMR